MTTDEIKAIIAEKIAGQGNQVDIGNGLAEVLNAIIDSIPEGGGSVPEPVSGIQINGRFGLATPEQMAQMKSNCLAGQNTILSADNTEYTVVLSEGNLCLLYPDEETNTVLFSHFEESE